MHKKNKQVFSPIKRNNYDFELLYEQQQEMQRLTNQTEISLIKVQSKYNDKPYSETSLVFLTSTNPVRKAFIRFALNLRFDYFILSVILANCFVLILDDQMPGNSWSVYADITFLIIFTFECVMKIIATGFVIGSNTYLRDGWNVIDFCVVLVGWFGYINSSRNISIVRTIRILRPLRTINTIPEMKILTISIIKSLPLLFNIFLLLIAFIFLFALVGTQIYGGTFSQRCYTMNGVATETICYLDPKCMEYQLNCGNSGCDVNQYC